MQIIYFILCFLFFIVGLACFVSFAALGFGPAQIVAVQSFYAETDEEKQEAAKSEKQLNKLAGLLFLGLFVGFGLAGLFAKLAGFA